MKESELSALCLEGDSRSQHEESVAQRKDGKAGGRKGKCSQGERG